MAVNPNCKLKDLSTSVDRILRVQSGAVCRSEVLELEIEHVNDHFLKISHIILLPYG